MSICFIIIFCTLCYTMWLPRIWLSFFRSRCTSQASLVGFGVSYKVEPLIILKAPYLTGQPARLEEARQLSRDEHRRVRRHHQTSWAHPSRSRISRPANYLEIVAPFATVKCFGTGQLPWDCWAFCDRQVPRNRSTTSRSSSCLRPSSASRPINYIEIVDPLVTFEYLETVKHLVTSTSIVKILSASSSNPDPTALSASDLKDNVWNVGYFIPMRNVTPWAFSIYLSSGLMLMYLSEA